MQVSIWVPHPQLSEGAGLDPTPPNSNRQPHSDQSPPCSRDRFPDRGVLIQPHPYFQSWPQTHSGSHVPAQHRRDPSPHDLALSAAVALIQPKLTCTAWFTYSSLLLALLSTFNCRLSTSANQSLSKKGKPRISWGEESRGLGAYC